jgi:hypothetical protein
MIRWSLADASSGVTCFAVVFNSIFATLGLCMTHAQTVVPAVRCLHRLVRRAGAGSKADIVDGWFASHEAKDGERAEVCVRIGFVSIRE